MATKRPGIIGQMCMIFICHMAFYPRFRYAFIALSTTSSYLAIRFADFYQVNGHWGWPF